MIQKETEASKDVARNFIITIATGGIGLEGILAAKGLLYVYRVAQLTIPIVATITTIPDIQSKLADVPGGSELIDAVNALNIFVGVLSAGELVTAIPDICKNVSKQWKNIRNNAKTKVALGDDFDEIDEAFGKLDELAGTKGVKNVAKGIEKVFYKSVDEFAATFDPNKKVSSTIRGKAFNYYKQGKWAELENLFKKRSKA